MRKDNDLYIFIIAAICIVALLVAAVILLYAVSWVISWLLSLFNIIVSAGWVWFTLVFVLFVGWFLYMFLKTFNRRK